MRTVIYLLIFVTHKNQTTKKLNICVYLFVHLLIIYFGQNNFFLYISIILFFYSYINPAYLTLFHLFIFNIFKN